MENERKSKINNLDYQNLYFCERKFINSAVFNNKKTLHFCKAFSLLLCHNKWNNDSGNHNEQADEI